MSYTKDLERKFHSNKCYIGIEYSKDWYILRSKRRFGKREASIWFLRIILDLG
jgi:hypothetical protein